MRNSTSEPTLKSTRNNIGNGYGQYCILDDESFNPPSKKFPTDKIKIKIGTPIASSEDLQMIETENNNKSKFHYRHKIFLAGLYLTTAVIIGLEYWFCFKR
jgi:hypothetical protein